MTDSLYELEFNTSGASPLVAELQAVFAQIPWDDLRPAFKPYACGRIGYGWQTIWKCYLAGSYLNIPSFAALRRTLQDNPALRYVCDIESYDGVPSQWAFSRFVKKMEWLAPRLAVKDCFRFLVKRLSWRFPDFGESVAIDSTSLKAWSRPGLHIPSDPDAGWSAKTDKAGKPKYIWGYKAHVLCDTETELPISLNMSPGNIYDGDRATNVLSEAKRTIRGFRPRYVLCDAGYSGEPLWRAVKRGYCSKPVIKPNPKHNNVLRLLQDHVPEWREIYPRRESVERIFSRLKLHRRLDSITVRGRKRVEAHCYIPLIVMNALALAMPETPRQVVRAAA